MDGIKNRYNLESNEIIRLSVKDTGNGDYSVAFVAKGPQGPIMQAINEVAGQYDMICVPKGMLEAVIAMNVISDILGDLGDSEDKTEEEPKENSASQEE